MNDNECKAEFRFLRVDIYTLNDIMNIPEIFTCYNDVKVTGTEALCILLKRYSYPNRYFDLIPTFGRPVPKLCLIANHVMTFIYERWHHLLTSFNQHWLPPAIGRDMPITFTKVELHRKIVGFCGRDSEFCV